MIELRKMLWVLSVGSILASSACVPKESSITQLSAPGTPPATGISYAGFTGLATAQTKSASTVQLNWNAATDARVVQYNIYDVTIRSAPRLIKPVNAPGTSTLVTGLAAQEYHVYRVRAVDASGTEDTNTADLGAIAYAGIVGAVVNSSSSATITFSDASNSDAVGIYCSTIAAPVMTPVVTLPTTSATTYTLTNLTGGVAYTCRASVKVNGLDDNNQKTVTFTPMGVATQIVYDTQPGNGIAGQALAGQPVLRILDASGTLVSSGPDSNATVTLTITTGGGTILPSNTASANGGIATFAGLKMNESGTKVMTATKADTLALGTADTPGSGTLTVDSANFTVAPDVVSAARSSIATVEPGPLVADGNSSYTVVMTLKDQFNNVIGGVKPQFASSISGDGITQPLIATDAINGTSSGSILTTVADDTRQLYVSSPANLTGVRTGASFIAGSPTKLSFVLQPSSAGAGGVMGAVKVAVQDSFANTVKTSNASISLAIASNVNGATLSGTIPAVANQGIATFSDLSINKTGSGYKLLASSGALTPGYSNTFNITAGSPVKISVTTPTPTTLSGGCSAAITIQLQDSGNNPSSAIQSTPVNISGLGAGGLYTSSACNGAALSSLITFTAGTSTKTVYFKDAKAEPVTMVVSDPSNVLTAGNLPLRSAPSKIMLSGAATSVVAGQCSQPFTITTLGDNGNPGPLFTATPVVLTGINGSSALVFSDPTCTTQIDYTNIVLPVSTGGIYTTQVYVKDQKAETLNLNVSEPTVMTTTSALQTLNVLASNILFAGPSSVIAGKCSTAFTITLRDAAGNSVPAPANTPLTLNGLAGSTTGQFFTNASCSVGGSNTTVTVPSGAATMSVYFKDTTAETLNIFLSDPAGLMANSNTLAIGISPSALGITSAVTTAGTSSCVGPFTLSTLDGTGNVTAAISPINVTLTGAGTAGAYYADAACTNAVSTFTFAAGDSQKTFYFIGQYPDSPTFGAADNASVLQAATYPMIVTGAIGFIGTNSVGFDGSGNPLWFRAGFNPVTARADGMQAAYVTHFDASKQYLYVLDSAARRVLKYDYVNQKYIGWLGGYFVYPGSGVAITGSNLTTPSNASCNTTTSGSMTPGWCVGGQSTSSGLSTAGVMNYPQGLTDDGTYLYVADRSAHAVLRYNATTGAFAGWIGRASSTPSGPAAGGPATCSSIAANSLTPGWCLGGTNTGVTNPLVGNGNVQAPRSVLAYGSNLYVGTQGAIMRYNLTTGTFNGWIGWITSTAPTGGATNCTSTTNAVTPGWCTGGSFALANPRSSAGAVNDPTSLYTDGSILYVMHTDSGGTITMYNLASGAYIGRPANLSSNWVSPFAMTSDGTYFYIADWNRIIQIDATGTVQGWVGKVATTPVGGASGCSTAVANSNTPGWCQGGTSKYGIDEGAFAQVTGVDFDGNGKLVAGMGNNFPALRQYSTATGAYLGQMAWQGTSPRQWSIDGTSIAQYGGFSDRAMNQPMGMYNDGTTLFLAEAAASRIKRINMQTGAVTGWIGGITTSPTGGDATCTGATPFGPSPAFCLGQLFQPNWLWNVMMSQFTNGIFYSPSSVVGDGANLYTVDVQAHRVQKFSQTTGAYVGWIGNVSTTPTGGGSTCTSTTSGNFTPTWCTGGISTSGSGNGMLSQPSAITISGGTLYVVDSGNNRVSSYNAATGAFNGWIGRVGTAPTGGCTTASNGSYVVSTSGWCLGGAAAQATSADRGGGFNFDSRAGITTDGNYLYISNSGNVRIDRWSLAGVFGGAVSSRWDNYGNVWTTNANTLSTTWANVGCMYPRGLWTDGTYIFGTGANQCGVNNASAAWKLNLSTGTMVGWRGRIVNAPSGGDPGCAGATGNTPGWCQGGAAGYGYTLGGFTGNSNYITGDANFVYVSDENSHRVTRLPK